MEYAWDSLLNIVFPAIGSTLYMMFFATLASFALGLLLAIILVVTEPGNLFPCRIAHLLTEALVSFILSMPFVILAVFLIPFTQLIVGTCVGKTAALVPLTIAESAFVAKLFRNALKEVNPWAIQGVKAFGASRMQIIGIIVKESIPYLVSNITIAIINVLNATSMVGIVGAGGIGAVAVTYGYQKGDYTVLLLAAICLIVFVYLLQTAGDKLYLRIK